MSWLLADISFGPPLPPTLPNNGGEAIGMIVSGVLLAAASVSVVFLRKRNRQATIVASVFLFLAALMTFIYWENHRGKERTLQSRIENFDKASERYLEAERLRNTAPRDQEENDRF